MVGGGQGGRGARKEKTGMGMGMGIWKGLAKLQLQEIERCFAGVLGAANCGKQGAGFGWENRHVLLGIAEGAEF